MSKTIRANLKILVIGPSGVGKTSFVQRWTKDEYQENYKPTVVSEFGFKIYNSKNFYYHVQLWDIGGADRSPSIAKIFSRDSHGVIVISDASQKNLIDEIIKWKDVVEKQSKFIDGEKLPFLFVQNKIDLINENEYEEIENLSKKIKDENGFCNYFLSSVKNNKNINEAMDFLIEVIIDRLEKYESQGNNEVFMDRKRKDTVVLRNNSEVTNEKKCC